MASLSLSLSFSSCLRMLCCKTRLDLCCQPSIMHSEGMLARMSSSCLQLGAPLATMPDGLRMQLTEHHSPVVTSHVFRNASRFGSNSNSRNSTGAGLLVYSEVHEIKGLQHGLHRTSILQCSRAVGMCPGTAVRGLQSFASVHLGSFRHAT